MESLAPILDKHGLAAIIVIALMLFFWFGAWPFIKEQWVKAQERREKDLERFVGVIKESHEVTRKQTEAIEKLTEHIGDAMSEIKGKGRR